MWMTTPEPLPGGEVVYPSNSVPYNRETFELPQPPLFFSHWYVGVMIIVLMTLVAYILLAARILQRFECLKQRKAKQVVAQAYLRDGFFDLESYTNKGSMGSFAHRQHASSGGSPSLSSRSGVRPGELLIEHGGGTHSSDSNSPSSSESQGAAVWRNPLQR
ncbi:hypothetical protein JKF63_07882 [Porcisia hertigi]|uniref:Uncharacterized protein n=1 Tax=Porcisia hertigi TaxID=2761500 RepID=A0A837A9V7_9TRYP|nr:hypothetical protein JKF63_07882 [Porcisia hertigi]